jgi:hypothetical protein
LIQPKQRADFERLAAQPIWPGGKLKTLLGQVELAGYNRELINWQLDDKVYQEFVLSPVIEDSTINPPLSTGPDWRRPLWEEFYPRIRHESSVINMLVSRFTRGWPKFNTLCAWIITPGNRLSGIINPSDRTGLPARTRLSLPPPHVRGT